LIIRQKCRSEPLLTLEELQTSPTPAAGPNICDRSVTKIRRWYLRWATGEFRPPGYVGCLAGGVRPLPEERFDLVPDLDPLAARSAATSTTRFHLRYLLVIFLAGMPQGSSRIQRLLAEMR
jgi:hypothetical protein